MSSRLFDPAVLAMLDPDEVVRVEVRAGALLRALEAHAGGPAELSTQQAAAVIGRTSKFWREHAARVAAFWQAREGRAGAYMDEVGRWRLVNAAARAYLAVHGQMAGAPTPPSPIARRTRRGPRRAPNTPTRAPTS